MAHDILKDSVEAQTGRASLMIIGILVGGVLVINSYIASWLFDDPAGYYRDLLALVGALLLSAPLFMHAIHGLCQGRTGLQVSTPCLDERPPHEARHDPTSVNAQRLFQAPGEQG